MGHRAVIGYNDGEVTWITTNNWSMILPEVMRTFIEEKRKENKDFDLDTFATDLFGKIRKINRLESIGVLPLSDLEKDNDRGWRVTYHVLDQLENGDALVCSTYSGGDKQWADATGEDVETAVKGHYNAEDGISMYYTKGEGKIHFYIDPRELDMDDEESPGSKFPLFCGSPVYPELS